MEYWDSKGNIYNTSAKELDPITRAYNFILAKTGDINPQDVAMGAISTTIPASKVKYLPQILSASKLLIHKPFDKMTKQEYNKYGKLGKRYYKDYIQGNMVTNDIIGDVDFKGAQAGKPDYRYMEQYPFLRKNLEEANENITLPTNKERADAIDFDNLKVNWKGKDYTYQVRNNPDLPTKDFYNIKPYDILLKQLKNK